MPAHMTPAQLRKAGIEVPGVTDKKGRSTKKEASGPYHTRCTTCDEEFTVIKREDEHVRAGHNRFEVVR